MCLKMPEKQKIIVPFDSAKKITSRLYISSFFNGLNWCRRINKQFNYVKFIFKLYNKLGGAANCHRDGFYVI